MAEATKKPTTITDEQVADLRRRFGDAGVIVVAHPSVPAKDLRELIALAQQKPGQINFGSSGIGSGTHVGGELLGGCHRLRFERVGNGLDVLAGCLSPVDRALGAGRPGVDDRGLQLLCAHCLRLDYEDGGDREQLRPVGCVIQSLYVRRTR